LTDRNLSRRVLESCPSLKKVLGEQLAENLYVIVKGTAEDQTEVGDTPSAGPEEPGRPAAGSKTPALDLYTLNSPDRAKKARSTRSSAAISRSASHRHLTRPPPKQP